MSARMSACCGVADLLGGDVVGRAEHLPLVGQPAFYHPLALDLRQAEVEHLDDRLAPRAGEQQVGRLDVAVDHPVFVRVLEAQGRLVDVLAGVGNRQRPLRLDDPGQVEAVDILHGQDQALAEAEARVGGDNVRMSQPGRIPHLADEAVEDTPSLQQVAADDLEDLQPPHERVLGEVDHTHAPLPQLAEDLVVRVVGQPRGQVAWRSWHRPARYRPQHREAVERCRRLRRCRTVLHRLGAVGGQRSDPTPAIRTVPEVLLNRRGCRAVELAQGKCLQDGARRMRSEMSIHGNRSSTSIRGGLR